MKRAWFVWGLFALGCGGPNSGAAVSDGSSAETSASGGDGASDVAGAPTRPLRLAMCDYGGLTVKNLDFVATHFDAIIDARADGHAIDVNAVHAKSGGRAKVYAYWDTHVAFLPKLDPAEVDAGAPNIDGGWYFYDTDPASKGYQHRLVVPGSPLAYLMKPEGADWQAYSIAHLRDALAQEPYDGFHLDDVWFDPSLQALPQWLDDAGTPQPYRSVPGWYPGWLTQFPTQMTSYLKAVRAAFPTTTIVFNGLDEPQDAGAEEGESKYLDVPLQGFVMENSFAGYGKHTDDTWVILMNAWLKHGTPGVLVGVNAYPSKDSAVQERFYSLGSYLLGASPDSTLSLQPNCTTLAYYPEFDLDYGAPTDSRPTSIDKLYDPTSRTYARAYEHALIVVNPSSSPAGTRTLPKPMYRLKANGGSVAAIGGDGSLGVDQVSSVTLDAASAALLVDQRPAGL